MQLIAPYDLDHKQIKCPLIDCFAGMGLAGMGLCTLHGMWWSLSCPEYLNEDEELERWKKECMLSNLLEEK